MSAKKVVGAILSMIVRLAIAIAVLYFIYQAVIAAYNFGYRVFADIPAALSPGRDIEITLTESMSEKEMAKEFERVGLVEDWKLFWVQIMFSEYKDDVEPGIYTLNNSMTSEELMAAIAPSSSASEEDEE
ncbi:MAG: hypothetical protein K6G07_04435 [Lachnospiraceae bacterium]|nr:hypothetical protein [Lachnospiraceae bacterium]